MKLTLEGKARRDDERPGSFEQLVLLALARLHEQAYAGNIERTIERCTLHRPGRNVVCRALRRLLARGWVSVEQKARAGNPGPRPRCLYHLRARGRRSLRLALAATDALRDGVLGLDHPASPRGKLP